MRTRADLVCAADTLNLGIRLGETGTVQSGEEVRVQRGDSAGKKWQLGELGGPRECVNERAGRCGNGGGEGGAQGFGLENIRDVVRFQCLGNGWRRNGPHQIGWMGIWDEERDDGVGCDGVGNQ